MGCVGQESVDKHKNLSFRRELIGGVSYVDASEAEPNENHLFVLRERFEGFDQGLGVFLQRFNGLDWSWIDPGGGEFDGSDAVTGGFKEGFELVPDPSSMISVVNQHKVLFSLHNPGSTILVCAVGRFLVYCGKER